MAAPWKLRCPRCRLQWARYDFCCLVCRVEVRKPEAWNFATAYRLATSRVAGAAGLTAEEYEQRERGDSGVRRAREQFEIAAPAMARLQLALTLGTSPEELDRVRGGARLMLESIKQSLAIVGLRAGEEVSVDLSERMQGFLDRWQERKGLVGQPEVIEADPGEPARRLPSSRDDSASS